MRRVLAIASIAARHAVRSRFFISLLLLLLVVVVGLPLTVKGDGTVLGEARILLKYTLACSAVVLGSATLWLSCGMISQEITEKRIRMIAVKPVGSYQVWLGKWLGICAINAVLLCIVGGVCFSLLHWRFRSTRLSREAVAQLQREVLAGREIVGPALETIDDQALARVDALLESKTIKPEQRAFTFTQIRESLLIAALTVAPGTSTRWTLALPSPHAAGEPLGFRFVLSSSFRSSNPVTGTWFLGTEAEPFLYPVPVTNVINGPHSFAVPAALLAGHRQLALTFTNREEGVSHAAVFRTEDGIQLLVPRSSFAANFARAILVLFCHMMLLSALGITAGTLFSFPVATFVAMGVVFMALTAHGFTAGYREEAMYMEMRTDLKAPFMVRMGARLLAGINRATGPVLELNPLDLLAEGVVVSWRFTGKALLLLGCCFPLGLWGIGGLALRRKELAR